ncbi:MAG TPA: molybdate ABC transporter substrate-binding protein [Pirellulales bacterium]|jgi:molybdate transport system substrate-binding protein
MPGRLSVLRWSLSQRSGIALSVAVTALLALSGCGAKQEPAEKGATSDVAADATVRIAAASDLQFALKGLVAKFNDTHPKKRVEATFGSSGSLYAQLANKAPFDMFLSADMSYPRKLIEAGLAAKESEFLYAIGHLVVWVPSASKLNLDTDGIKALADPAVKVIAMANPKHAPYGRVAEEALKSQGVYDDVKDRLVLGENVSQTAHFVQSGAADAGLIALSLALAPEMKARGRYWSVPTDAYSRLEQGGVIMNDAKDAAAAGEFRGFMTGEEGKTILREYGFALPGE